MSEVPEYFVSDSCSNKDFVPIHNFGVRFHGVNFSDELIYDKIFEEKFQCTECLKVFSKTDIETGLVNLRIKRRRFDTFEIAQERRSAVITLFRIAPDGKIYYR